MRKESGLLHNLYEALASLKLTVFIFLVLAACSIVGTLFPQGLTFEQVDSQFTPGAAWWIKTLGLNDLYRTGWFQLLLLLLCVNLVVCTLQRLPKTIKLLRRREDHVDPQKLSRFNYSREITVKAPWTKLEGPITQVFSKGFASIQKIEDANAFTGVAEKGRWSLWMVYVVHLSILVILFGSLLGSIFGFKGFMNISEGEAAAEVTLYSGSHSVMLPFEIRCDKFEVSYYDNGMPKEFRSDLTVLDKGKDIHKQEIRVNDPMTYDGVTFYQASYGTNLKQAEIEFTDTASGKTYTLTLPFRQMVEIPGTRDQVQVMEYRQDLSGFGPAMVLALAREGQQPMGSWVLVKKPEFHGNRIQNYRIKVLQAKETSYTGLQVKRDPGLWIVWVGFASLLIGIGMIFYASHRKVWVWAGPSSPGSNTAKILVSGRTTKNPLAFEQEFNELCKRLEELLKPENIGKQES